MSGDLWEVRTLHGGLSVELRGGEKPALVFVQGTDRVRVELADVKSVHSYGASHRTERRATLRDGMVAAMANAAADLAAHCALLRHTTPHCTAVRDSLGRVMAAGGVYHAWAKEMRGNEARNQAESICAA